jgi:hypothetical protein
VIFIGLLEQCNELRLASLAGALTAEEAPGQRGLLSLKHFSAS